MTASSEEMVSPEVSVCEEEEDFQSADELADEEIDEDDDFDLPQDMGIKGVPTNFAAAPGLGGGGGLPPGFDPSAAQDCSGTDRWNLRHDGNKEELEPIWLELTQDREHIKISKMFSYVLRHAAHKLDVTIRKDGFVRLRDIMKLKNFKPYDLEQLMAVVYFDEKDRYTMVREYDGELLIRANQGHTMKVVEDDLLLETVTDASMVSDCVHGTYLVHWPFIKRQGLSKVARNHIHLANGLPEDGKIRGMRQTSELFVYVDVKKAMDDGIVFYKSKNEVILTQGLDGWLPPKYFAKAVRIDYNTCDIEDMEFDRDVETPGWAAELAPSGPGEAGTYLIKNLEALISNCKKRLAECNELKAAVEAGKELDPEEEEKLGKHAQVYTELQSLEQRFRQHKGYRKESVQDRDHRMREEAEARTVVERKDRAVTPPWERGKPSALEQASNMRATEKEKAEWAELGRRRDTAPTPTAKKEDMWSRLRGNTAGPAAAPSDPSKDNWRFRDEGEDRRSRDEDKRPRDEDSSWRSRDDDSGRRFRDDDSSRRFRDDDSSRRFRDDDSSRRFRDDDRPMPGRGDRADRTESQRFGREESARMSTTSTGGPPRFFNSKKDTGVSWRDRVGTVGAKEDDRRDSARGGYGGFGGGERGSGAGQHMFGYPSGGGPQTTPQDFRVAAAAPEQPAPGWCPRATRPSSAAAPFVPMSMSSMGAPMGQMGQMGQVGQVDQMGHMGHMGQMDEMGQMQDAHMPAGGCYGGDGTDWTRQGPPNAYR